MKLSTELQDLLQDLLNTCPQEHKERCREVCKRDGRTESFYLWSVLWSTDPEELGNFFWKAKGEEGIKNRHIETGLRAFLPRF